MYELPDELWNLIKSFTFDWQRSHKQKMEETRLKIHGCYKEVFERWTLFPPWPNTNDIIREEYLVHTHWAPIPNLELTSITKWTNANINSTGWYCGYGWKKNGEIN